MVSSLQRQQSGTASQQPVFSVKETMQEEVETDILIIITITCIATAINVQILSLNSYTALSNNHSIRSTKGEVSPTRMQVELRYCNTKSSQYLKKLCPVMCVSQSHFLKLNVHFLGLNPHDWHVRSMKKQLQTHITGQSTHVKVSPEEVFPLCTEQQSHKTQKHTHSSARVAAIHKA